MAPEDISIVGVKSLSQLPEQVQGKVNPCMWLVLVLNCHHACGLSLPLPEILCLIVSGSIVVCVRVLLLSRICNLGSTRTVTGYAHHTQVLKCLFESARSLVATYAQSKTYTFTTTTDVFTDTRTSTLRVWFAPTTGPLTKRIAPTMLGINYVGLVL